MIIHSVLTRSHFFTRPDLSNIKTAIAALASDPPPEINREKALNLCGDLCRSLWYDRRDVRASNLVPAWRDVFAALTQLVQRTQVEGSGAARYLIDECFSLIEDVDEIDNSDDDAEYAAWLTTFKSKDSPVPDELISELLRIHLNPEIQDEDEDEDMEYSYPGLWRIRRLKDLFGNTQSQTEGSVRADTLNIQLAMSRKGSNIQGSPQQPNALAAGDVIVQIDATSLYPIGSHEPLPQRTSNEVPNTVSGMAMALTTNNAYVLRTRRIFYTDLQ